MRVRDFEAELEKIEEKERNNESDKAIRSFYDYVVDFMNRIDKSRLKRNQVDRLIWFIRKLDVKLYYEYTACGGFYMECVNIRSSTKRINNTEYMIVILYPLRCNSITDPHTSLLIIE